jgi:hypothetical protein
MAAAGPLADPPGSQGPAPLVAQRAGLGPGAEDIGRRTADVAPPPPAAQKYHPGDRVRHRAYGDGVVLESVVTRRGEEEVRVRFDVAGIKVLLGALAPMEVL